jgi:gliding motility-associated-like protein
MRIKNLFGFLTISTMLTINGLAQVTPVTVCLGDDTTVCQGQTVVINNCTTGTGGPLGTLFLNSPVSLSLSDDVWSAAVPLGFTFNYYGVNYTQCVIGSNGLVSFNLANANSYCPWVLNGTPIPGGAAGGNNSAMGIYCDMNPSNASSGPVQYQTIGTAPNRIFVALYKGVTGFSCTNSCSYMSILFYEGSNNIEFHVGSKQTCGTWNGDLAIQGVQNVNGTQGIATPGRNNTIWMAVQDGRRYTPTSPTNTNGYTISTIPYITVTSNGAAGSGIEWKNTLNQTFPYNNGSLTITNVPAGTTGYFISGTSCNASIGAISDTTYITRSVSAVSTTSVTDTCNGGNGILTATPGTSGPYSYSWSNLPNTTSTVNNVVAGTYTVTAFNSDGCPATSTITVGNVLATTNSSSTLVSCPGGSDGTATAEMLPLGASTTYQWDDPAAQTTQTAVGLSAGTYNCTITSSNGCVEIVSVTVSEIPGMIATIVNKQDVTCYTGNDGLIALEVINGTGPYSYLWSGSSSIDSIATDLFVGPQQVDITDSNGCVISVNTILSEPMPLSLSNVTTDTMICSESTIVLSAMGNGGSSPYIFTWFENGIQISTDQFPLVDPVNSGTVYEVVLSEQCGSPTTSQTLTIVFPTPIQPIVVPDPPQACAPDTFRFVNASTNNSEIATTFYEFSNGITHTMNGLDTASQLFVIPNDYDVNMTVTSIYGCVYTEFFPIIIKALKKPKALFGMNANPTTIFETRVKMSDKSVDATAWEWIANQATPGMSSLQNPEFHFPQVEGFYPINLKVTSPLGCWDTITVLLNIQSDILFYAPNAFTPDNDEHNPTWKFAVAGMDLTSFELYVYNRWGEVVWQTYDPNAEWDGTYKGRLLESGSYNWRAKFKKFGKEDFQTTTGNVAIIR